MTYTYTPERETFTEREVQDILSRIKCSRAYLLVCRIDGDTCYTIERIENNKEKMAQYNVSLNCYYADNFESYTHILSYVETLNFLRAFKVITFEYLPMNV